MSVLAALAATVPATPVEPEPTDPYAIVGDTTPYAMPSAAPWNAPTYAITPTPDTTGSVVHPSVHDFGAVKWNGRRFWMAVTPYKDSDDQKENPAILRSHDAFTFEVPPGLTNPIDPPPSGGYNSDTELYWDEPSGRLYCFWRSVTSSATVETIWRAYSTDGVTWSTKAVAALSDSGGSTNLLSPAIRKLGSTFYLWTNTRRLSSSTIDGTFGSAVSTTWNGQGGATIPGTNWHIGVEVVGTEVWALLNKHSPYKTFAAKSTDGGITFTVNATPVIEPSAVGGWDNGDFNGTYRACFQLHENGTHTRLWYSALSPNTTTSWRVGYTRVPRTVWTSIS